MPKFNPTQAMIEQAEALFTAIAYESHLMPIVLAYQRAILSTHQFRVSAEFCDIGGADNEPITDPALSYLLSDADARVYFDECNRARIAAGLVIDKEGQCPLLLAQHVRSLAETTLVTTVANSDKRLKDLIKGLELSVHRQKTIDLVTKLIAPYCRNAAAILAEIKQAPI